MKSPDRRFESTLPFTRVAFVFGTCLVSLLGSSFIGSSLSLFFQIQALVEPITRLGGMGGGHSVWDLRLQEDAGRLGTFLTF